MEDTFNPLPNTDQPTIELNSILLVLDNLDTEIRTANKRNDLLPVYSFNVNGLWLAKSRSGESRRVGKSTRLSPWRDVTARINSEFTR